MAGGQGPGRSREVRWRFAEVSRVRRFKIGIAVGRRVLEEPEDAALIRRHVQILATENCIKPQSIHAAEDRRVFEAAERFVEFARANTLEAVGHCLMWAKDDRADEGVKRGRRGDPLPRPSGPDGRSGCRQASP